MRKAKCNRCGKVAWVNYITRDGDFAGEFCGDCFDDVPKDRAPRNQTSASSGTDHNDPWRDNAVRALEGDCLRAGFRRHPWRNGAMTDDLRARVERLREYAARHMKTHTGNDYQGLEDALAIADALEGPPMFWRGRRCKVEGGTWMLSRLGHPDDFEFGVEHYGAEAVAGSFPPHQTVEMVPLPGDGPLLLLAGGQAYQLDGPPGNCLKWVISPLALGRPDGGEPADSEWAEAVGFEFSDRDEMYRYVGSSKNLKVMLTGDLATGEKDTHLSLHWSNWPNKPQHSGSLGVEDNPTRDDVRRLFAGLGEPLTEKAT